MNRLIGFSVVLLGCFGGPLVVSAQDLVADYRFEDGGNLGLDTSAFGNDATVVAGVGQVAGHSGVFSPNAASFDNSSNFRQNGGLAGYDGLPGLTFAAWVNRSAADGDFGGIVSQDAGGCCTNRLLLHPSDSIYVNAGHHHDFNFGGPSVVPNNAWHHVVMTGEQVGGDVQINVYRDGSPVGSVTDVGHSLANASALNTYLGRGEGGSAHPIIASLDDVKIYDGALSAPQADRLFQTGAIEVQNITFEQQPPQTDFTIDGQQFLPPGGGHIVIDHATGHVFETANQLGTYDLLVTVFNPLAGDLLDIDKDALNLTDTAWSDFHIEVEETPQIGFAPQGDPIFLSAMDSSDPGIGFDVVDVMPQMVWFSSGPGVDPGETWKGWLSLQIGGANGVAINPDTNLLEPVYQFIMGQTPSFAVPEPGTVLIGMLGIAGMAYLAWRRKRKAA